MATHPTKSAYACYADGSVHLVRPVIDCPAKDRNALQSVFRSYCKNHGLVPVVNYTDEGVELQALPKAEGIPRMTVQRGSLDELMDDDLSVMDHYFQPLDRYLATKPGTEDARKALTEWKECRGP